MGMKTFESLPNGPLPKRNNIVLTNDDDFKPEGVTICRSIQEVLALDLPEIIVIGGGEIYKQFMSKARVLEMTHIWFTFPKVDTFFPEIDPEIWYIEKSSGVKIDEYRYEFKTYKRRIEDENC